MNSNVFFLTLDSFLKLSNSSNKKGMLDPPVMRSKPNKMFAMIKSEMDEKAKKKSKLHIQVIDNF